MVVLVRKRQRHSEDFRAGVVAACRQPGVSVAAVALAHGSNADLVRRWIKESTERLAVTRRPLAHPVAEPLTIGLWVSRRAAPAAILPATTPALVHRCARNAYRRCPVRRYPRGSASTRSQVLRLGKSCPTGCGTVWPILPWLSFAMRSVASEPNHAGLLLGSRRSPPVLSLSIIGCETWSLRSTGVGRPRPCYTPIRHPRDRLHPSRGHRALLALGRPDIMEAAKGPAGPFA